MALFFCLCTTTIGVSPLCLPGLPLTQGHPHTPNALPVHTETQMHRATDMCSAGLLLPIKATIPHVRASKGAYIHVSATLHYKGARFVQSLVRTTCSNQSFGTGTPYQVHVSAAKAAVDASQCSPP